MYDYLSISLPINSIDKIRSKFEFEFAISDTGEPKRTKGGFIFYKSSLRNMTISYLEKDGVIYSPKLNGSIHKYYEQGSNFKQFNLKAFETTLNDLNTIIGIDLTQCEINGLEYGYNLNIGQTDPNSILNSMLVYKMKRPELQKYESNGLYLRFNNAHYSLKFYNKSAQYTQVGANILRAELKVSTMQFLHTKGVNITRVSDLLDMAKIDQLHKILKWGIEQTLFIANSTPQSSEFRTLKHGLNFANWQNAMYWANLNSRQYSKQKGFYSNALQRFGLETYKSSVLELIETTYQKTTGGKFYPNIVCNNNPLTNPVKCLQCGKDISKQKKGSKFCRTYINGKENKTCKNGYSNPIYSRQAKQRKKRHQYTLWPLFEHYAHA